MVKMTTTSRIARLREILSAIQGKTRTPKKDPSCNMDVMKLLPNALLVPGMALWNWSMTLMIEMTPWS